jgi:predicted NACHT family NTPase
MDRSRKLALTNWTLANDALFLRFAGNKSELTKSVKMSRTTVTAFFKGDPIREAEFRKVCTALLLNWQEISSVAPVGEDKKDDSLEQIRSHCREKIRNNYSKIRLLSGQEIDVDQLYVDVWLLDRSPRTFQRSADKMLETFDLRNDRLGLGDRIQRNPGFDVANQESKLLILGKPGAGKTTFLKHLAVDWCNDKFQAHLIAVFIEFRQIRNKRWQLLDAIGTELKIRNIEQVKTLLNDGRLLVLMDGFDEVPTQVLRTQVQHQLGQVVKEYSKNHYIMTCRTQIIQGVPDSFTSVEVADFNDNQVQSFVGNWFRANGQNKVELKAQWENFEFTINQNRALKELTVTPLLLGLMCLVLQDEGEIPAQAGLLYESGIRLLLQKWNDEKVIDGWEMGTESYRKLNVDQKEELLIKIAVYKFENPKNFVLFEQDDLLKQISQYLRLPNRSDAHAVLRAIESQHGLFVERADKKWSFSHLTFQEYFATKWLLSLSLKALGTKITNKRWQEIICQLVKTQGKSDHFLKKINQSIAFSMNHDRKLQEFLDWTHRKAQSISDSQDILSAKRSFYFSLAIALALDTTIDFDLAVSLDFDLDFDFDYDRSRDADFARNLDIDVEYDIARNLALDLTDNFNCNYLDFNLTPIIIHTIELAMDNNGSYSRDLAHARNLHNEHALDLACALKFDLDLDFSPTFMNELEELRADFIGGSIRNNRAEWWCENGQIWMERLRQAMIQCYNTGYDWQFTDDQMHRLQLYYEANKFLVGLLKIPNAVSPKARQEIEDNLLLPIAELKRRLPDQYGGIEES